MALLDRFRKLFARETSPDVGTSRDRVIWIGQTLAGVRMTPEEALKLSAVWACVSVISKSLASSVREVFIEELNGNREFRRQSNTYRLLNLRPNPEMTAFAFFEGMAIMALVWGNAIAEIERDIVGRPVALWPIAPDRFEFERDDDGNLIVRVYNFDRADALLPYRNVFHIHGPGVDGINGFEIGTPGGIAAQSFAHVAAAEKFGAAFYGNGTTFGGFLEGDHNLNEEQMKELQARINEKHMGPEQAFKFLVLTGGLKVAKNAITPEEGQFIETRQHMVEEVARWFGVPPHKIQDMRRSTFNNIEHQGLEFVNDALTPWAERFAQEANWKIVPVQLRGRMKTRFELDWLAEGDAKSKAETDSLLVNSGIETINSVLKKRGKNTIGPLGDQRIVQGAMISLEQALNPPEPPPPPALPPPDDDDQAEEAAQALFASAYRRCLTRLETRGFDIAKAARSQNDFAKRVAQYQPHYAKMIGDEIRDALETMERIGVPSEGQQERFKHVLEDCIRGDTKALTDAHANGGLAKWCDIYVRAENVAGLLASELTR